MPDIDARTYTRGDGAMGPRLGETRMELDSEINRLLRDRGHVLIGMLDGSVKTIAQRLNREWADASGRPVPTVEILPADWLGSVSDAGEAPAAGPVEAGHQDFAPDLDDITVDGGVPSSLENQGEAGFAGGGTLAAPLSENASHAEGDAMGKDAATHAEGAHPADAAGDPHSAGPTEPHSWWEQGAGTGDDLAGLDFPDADRLQAAAALGGDLDLEFPEAEEIAHAAAAQTAGPALSSNRSLVPLHREERIPRRTPREQMMAVRAAVAEHIKTIEASERAAGQALREQQARLRLRQEGVQKATEKIDQALAEGGAAFAAGRFAGTSYDQSKVELAEAAHNTALRALTNARAEVKKQFGEHVGLRFWKLATWWQAGAAVRERAATAKEEVEKAARQLAKEKLRPEVPRVDRKRTAAVEAAQARVVDPMREALQKAKEQVLKQKFVVADARTQLQTTSTALQAARQELGRINQKLTALDRSESLREPGPGELPLAVMVESQRP